MSARRRILLLSPFAPRHDAPHGGARLIAQQIEALAATHDVALCCLRGAAEPGPDELVRRSCALIEEVERTWARTGPLADARRAVHLIAALASGRPLWVANWREPAFEKRIEALLRTWEPHLIQAEFHVMGQYLPAARDRPGVLVEHEPGYAAARERWRLARGPLRLARRIDARAWRRFERDLLAQVDATVAFTPRDAEDLERLGGRPVTCIRPGISLPSHPLNAAGSPPDSVLFAGNFMHPPNLDAAWRLATVIHPRLRARFPDVRLYLVGDQPPERLRRLSTAHCVVTGRVPDVTPFLDRAAVVAAPLRHGGGIRVKVLEAISTGKAVVASALAIEGIGLVAEEHCLLAETDQEFVEAIGSLLESPERRARIAAAAHAYAQSALGWSRTIASYDALYERLLPGTGSRAGRTTASDDSTGSESIAAVTVAIATLDRPDGLAACLDALLAGPVLPAEIIVVDQSAGTASAPVAQRTASRGVRVRYARQTRLGLSAARNLGFALATEPVVAVTDDDCVPDARWVATLARVFTEHDRPDAVTGRVLPLGRAESGTYAVSSREESRRIEYRGRALPWAAGTGANFAVRRERMGAIGGYDERLGAGTAGAAGEDADVLYRLLRSGAAIRYEPDAIVRHARQNAARRKMTRTSYGLGIGACCASWLRRGDTYAVIYLARWVASRLRRLAMGIVRLEPAEVREELLVLAGTARGVRYGAGLSPDAPGRRSVSSGALHG